MKLRILTDSDLLAPLPTTDDQPGYQPYANTQQYVERMVRDLIPYRLGFYPEQIAIRNGGSAVFALNGPFVVVAKPHFWFELFSNACMAFYKHIDMWVPEEASYRFFDENEPTYEWAAELAKTKASELTKAYMDFVIHGDSFGEESREAERRRRTAYLFEALMSCSQPPFAPLDAIHRLQSYPFVDLSVRGRRDMIIVGQLSETRE